MGSHWRNETVVQFLTHFRESQMYEVFITERLLMASHGYAANDSFEAKVTLTRFAGLICSSSRFTLLPKVDCDTANASDHCN